MTRRFVAVLTVLAAVVGLSAAASAAPNSGTRGRHDVCIGWSPSPGVYKPIICINPPPT